MYKRSNSGLLFHLFLLWAGRKKGSRGNYVTSIHKSQPVGDSSTVSCELPREQQKVTLTQCCDTIFAPGSEKWLVATFTTPPPPTVTKQGFPSKWASCCSIFPLTTLEIRERVTKQAGGFLTARGRMTAMFFCVAKRMYHVQFGVYTSQSAFSM